MKRLKSGRFDSLLYEAAAAMSRRCATHASVSSACLQRKRYVRPEFHPRSLVRTTNEWVVTAVPSTDTCSRSPVSVRRYRDVLFLSRNDDSRFCPRPRDASRAAGQRARARQEGDGAGARGAGAGLDGAVDVVDDGRGDDARVQELERVYVLELVHRAGGAASAAVSTGGCERARRWRERRWPCDAARSGQGSNRMSLSGMKSRIRVGVPLVLSLPPSGSARESLVGRGEESREGRAAREADDFGSREHRSQLPVLSAS